MDFELSNEQRLLVDSVNNFVKKDSPIERFRKQRDVDPGWSKSVWAQMGDLGWLGLPFPEAVGGFGSSFLDAALVIERLGTTLVPEPFIPSVALAGMAIAKAGNAAQQERLLAPMIAGKTTLALAYAEQDSRYDVSWVQTRAEKKGTSYVLSGKKVWVLAGDSADQLVVSARTSGSPGELKGISLFALDRTHEKLAVTALKTADGRRAANLVLDGVELPADALLGEEGAQGPVLEEVIDYGAAAACAEGAGIIETVMEMTREYLCDRVQFGAPIGSFQALQHRAVDMFIELQLSKATLLLAAIKLDAPVEERKKAISIAKVQLTQSGQFVTRQGIQLHGGIGVTDEHNVGLYFKRINVLNALFGDEEFHVRRFGALPGFEAQTS
ncbi:MAG TPA: acyl-CoA dehydrogenase family protein [Polyangiales bacterium]|nr:acyl-CoA dehydrogenase family protein [Polyangiales bacterium]